jgi:hypothetical protein
MYNLYAGEWLHARMHRRMHTLDEVSMTCRPQIFITSILSQASTAAAASSSSANTLFVRSSVVAMLIANKILSWQRSDGVSKSG